MFRRTFEILSEIARHHSDGFINAYAMDNNISRQEAERKYHEFLGKTSQFTNGLLEVLARDRGLLFNKNEIGPVKDYISRFAAIYMMGGLKDKFADHIANYLLGTVRDDEGLINRSYRSMCDIIHDSFKKPEAASIYRKHITSNVLTHIVKAGIGKVVPVVLAGSLLALGGIYLLYHKKKEKEKERKEEGVEF